MFLWFSLSQMWLSSMFWLCYFTLLCDWHPVVGRLRMLMSTFHYLFVSTELYVNSYASNAIIWTFDAENWWVRIDERGRYRCRGASAASTPISAVSSLLQESQLWHRQAAVLALLSNKFATCYHVRTAALDRSIKRECWCRHCTRRWWIWIVQSSDPYLDFQYKLYGFPSSGINYLTKPPSKYLLYLPTFHPLPSSTPVRRAAATHSLVFFYCYSTVCLQ